MTVGSFSKNNSTFFQPLGTLFKNHRFIPPNQIIKSEYIQMLQFIQHIIFQLGQAFFAAEATCQGSMIAFEGQEEDGIFMMQILA